MQSARSTGGSRVTLGIVPDYSPNDANNGVKISGTTPTEHVGTLKTAWTTAKKRVRLGAVARPAPHRRHAPAGERSDAADGGQHHGLVGVHDRAHGAPLWAHQYRCPTSGNGGHDCVARTVGEGTLGIDSARTEKEGAVH